MSEENRKRQVFERIHGGISEEVKHIQQLVTDLSKKHKGLTGSPMESQKLILDSFFPTDEMLVKGKGEDTVYYGDFDTFYNSISQEKKDEITKNIFDRFLKELNVNEVINEQEGEEI
ncbi:hypothetical protein QK289_15545 [Exiguobacterium antarcticum]|uniref:Uncharacterized protein n=2 Tax=Exiguobacterium antarcticum TaxID=132920 RepID=A0ABT6R7Z6_9BACL|nr:hypothetical protein [Exiguobacterium antarcticum]